MGRSVIIERQLTAITHSHNQLSPVIGSLKRILGKGQRLASAHGMFSLLIKKRPWRRKRNYERASRRPDQQEEEEEEEDGGFGRVG